MVHFGPWCINRPVFQPLGWSAQGIKRKGHSFGLALRVVTVPGGDPERIGSAQSRFFILKRTSSTNETFHSVSPFLVEKAISGYLGEIPSVRKLRSGDLLVEVSSQKQAQIIIKLNNLASIPVTVTPHASLNFSKGVVSCAELLNTSIEEIADKLKSQGVTHVRRIYAKRRTTPWY
ncbi:hypothetical protein AVEN_56155-1 [Araneus ventricosus]|uniref:Uncharacterized protein n=1 Tax=Araneus ventricosus TaxID=182803 RepID=A0A4Y2MK24_ARAVE|nr:hypothetical protein AVEN_56155-1 [Araneus ventricosus]